MRKRRPSAHNTHHLHLFLRDESTFSTLSTSTQTSPTLRNTLTPDYTSTTPATLSSSQKYMSSTESSTSQSQGQTIAPTSAIATSSEDAPTADAANVAAAGAAPSPTTTPTSTSPDTSSGDSVTSDASTDEPTPEAIDEVMSSDGNKMRPVIGPAPADDQSATGASGESRSTAPESSAARAAAVPSSKPSSSPAPSSSAPSPSPAAAPSNVPSPETTSDIPLLEDDMNGAQRAIVGPSLSMNNQATEAPAAAAAAAPAPTIAPQAVAQNPLEGMLQAASAIAAASSQQVAGQVDSEDAVGRFGGLVPGATTSAAQDPFAANPMQPVNVASVLGITAPGIATAVRAGGPSGTIIGYTGSAGFTPYTVTASPTSTTTDSAHHGSVSKTPIIAALSVFGIFILIAIGVAVSAWIRHRLRDGMNFLCWKGQLRDDAMEELGFGDNYDAFKSGFKEQNKNIAKKMSDAENDQEKNGTDAAPDAYHQDQGGDAGYGQDGHYDQNYNQYDNAHIYGSDEHGYRYDGEYDQGSPAPVGPTPAFFMRDEPHQYRVANYAQGDYSVDNGSPSTSPAVDANANDLVGRQQWAPLRPQKQLRFQLDDPRSPSPHSQPRSKEPSLRSWNPFASPHDDEEQYDQQSVDKFTPAPVRRTRNRSTRSSLGAYPGEPERGSRTLGGSSPLARRVLDYYGIDDPATAAGPRQHRGYIEESPFADKHQYLPAPPQNMRSGSGFVAHAMLQPSDTAASCSVYSVVTHAPGPIHPLQVPQASTSMSSLRQAITHFRVEEEEPSEPAPTHITPAHQELVPNETNASMAYLRAKEQEEQAGDAKDEAAEAPVGVDEQSVKKVLRERSLVSRNG